MQSGVIEGWFHASVFFYARNANSDLQALVYDILPPSIAVIDYAIRLEKLSDNKQFFVGAQMGVSL